MHRSEPDRGLERRRRRLLLCAAAAAAILGGCRGVPDAAPESAPIAAPEVVSPQPALPETVPPAAEPEPAPPPDLEAPEIIAPRGTWALGTRFEVAFTPVRGASSYRIEAAREEEFTEPIGAAVVDVPPQLAAGTLRAELSIEAAAGETVHLRVRGETEDDRAGPWRLTQCRAVLAAPAAAAPGAGDASSPGKAVLSWTPVSGASGYEVEVAEAAAAEEAAPVRSIAVEGGGRTSIPLADPLPEGSYRFRARAIAGDHRGEWSEPARFTVRRPAPRLVSPEDGARLASRRPLFHWLPGLEEERSFELEIAASTDGGAPLETRIHPVTGSVFRAPAPLPRAARFRARVRAAGEGEAAPGPWSEPVAFAVLADRPDPGPVIPIAAGPQVDELRPAASPDGLRIAVAARPAPAAGSAAPARAGWTIEVIERAPGDDSSGPPYRRFPGREIPGAASGGGDAVGVRLAWALGRLREPVLLAAAVVERADGSLAGAIHRLDLTSPGGLDILPARFDGLPVRVSFPCEAAEPRIVFEARRTANGIEAGTPGEIWSLEPEGTGLRLIGLGRDPAVSPDGSRLAFIGDGAAGPEIRLLPLTPAGERAGPPAALPGERPPARALSGLAWSPRGDAIAFARDAGAGFDIAIARIADGAETAVTRSYDDDIDPSFLPDPASAAGYSGILFASDRDGATWNVYLAGTGD